MEQQLHTIRRSSDLRQPVGSGTKLNVPQNQSKSLAKSRLDETEEFVKNILDGCGKQALTI